MSTCTFLAKSPCAEPTAPRASGLEAPRVAMEALGRGLVEIKQSAMHTQALVSTTQWISGIAQANHGQEHVTAGGRQRAVTDLEYERADLHRGKPDGVLRIAVELPPNTRELAARREYEGMGKLAAGAFSA